MHGVDVRLQVSAVPPPLLGRELGVGERLEVRPHLTVPVAGHDDGRNGSTLGQLLGHPAEESVGKPIGEHALGGNGLHGLAGHRILREVDREKLDVSRTSYMHNTPGFSFLYSVKGLCNYLQNYSYIIIFYIFCQYFTDCKIGSAIIKYLSLT